MILASCADEGTGYVKFYVVERPGHIYIPVCGTDVYVGQEPRAAGMIEELLRCGKKACQEQFKRAREENVSR